MTDAAQTLEVHLQRELAKRVVGMESVIHGLTIASIARGHALLEGPPGLGKTRLSKAFAEVLGGTIKRIQGTADLMPSDITGVHIFNSQTQAFEFRPGPLFADVVLMDEVNRASPKTQSALLEAMEERQVSIDRESFALADNFMVIATMNPQEFEGTFPLPESQLDRFALSIAIDYLDRESEAKVLQTFSGSANVAANDEPLLTIAPQVLDEARASLEHIHLSPELLNYVLDIAAATRSSGAVNLGLSVRGALALARCARIESALRGGDFVVPDDVKAVAQWVMAHRLRMTAEATIDGVTSLGVVERILDQVAVPK